jgi:hypothetical protein
MAEPIFFAWVMGEAALLDAPVYVPVPVDMTGWVEEEGALGIVLASLLNGTDGFASSAYQLSSLLAL